MDDFRIHLTHGGKYQRLLSEGNLCEHTEYTCYSKNQVWLCAMCDKPVPEPTRSLGNRRILTVHKNHSNATGISMDYYNKYWEGNRNKHVEQMLADNNGVYNRELDPLVD